MKSDLRNVERRAATVCLVGFAIAAVRSAIFETSTHKPVHMVDLLFCEGIQSAHALQRPSANLADTCISPSHARDSHIIDHATMCRVYPAVIMMAMITASVYPKHRRQSRLASNWSKGDRGFVCPSEMLFSSSHFGFRPPSKMSHLIACKAVTTDDSNGETSEVARRALLAAGAVGAGVLGTDAALRATNEQYAAFGTILAPAPYRQTIRTELVPGQIWGFEQCIALASVSTNIRMTAVRLRDGSLWVCAPISPTRECLRQLDELGDVAHLVIPSTALEHKASLGEFTRVYPKASVWVAPGQSSFPIGVPPGSSVLGQGPTPPWADELEFKVFYVAPPITDVFAEVVFFHRETGSLLVTDCALKLPQSAPKVLESYGYDGTPGPISPEQWRYKAIAFDFVTSRGQDEADFEALSSPPALVNPLLRFVVYRRCPKQAAAWVEDVAKWPFVRIVPAHLQAPFDCTPTQFLDAFGFLFGKPSSWEPEDPQLSFLRALRDQVGGPTF